jgi:hypothetical protein
MVEEHIALEYSQGLQPWTTATIKNVHAWLLKIPDITLHHVEWRI